MVKLSRYIEYDLEQIADWIAEDNPKRALAVMAEIEEEFRRIGDRPLHYQLRAGIVRM